MTTDTHELIAANDACRKGGCPVQVMIPSGLDSLAPMMRLLPGALYAIRTMEIADDGAHEAGAVDVLGRAFRWEIATRDDAPEPLLVVHVPQE